MGLLGSHFGRRVHAGVESYYVGIIDEARISTIARSSDWISTTHNNQSSPSTFYSVGSEMTHFAAAPTPTAAATVTPTATSTDIPTPPPTPIPSVGTVKDEQKISDTVGDFLASLDDSDYFGYAIEQIGDIDDDGIEDVAVGAYYDDDGGTDRGAVYILFLGTQGRLLPEDQRYPGRFHVCVS